MTFLCTALSNCFTRHPQQPSYEQSLDPNFNKNISFDKGLEIMKERIKHRFPSCKNFDKRFTELALKAIKLYNGKLPKANQPVNIDILYKIENEICQKIVSTRKKAFNIQTQHISKPKPTYTLFSSEQHFKHSQEELLHV